MCVAAVGRVESINENKACVNFNGNLINVETGIVEVKVGDYVLVHAGCAIEVLKEDLAKDMENLFKEIEDSIYE